MPVTEVGLPLQQQSRPPTLPEPAWILCADPHQKKDTSGAHKFIRKHEIAGFWKVAGGDESDSAVEGDDAGSLVEEVHAARATPVGVDTGPGRSITVDLSHLEKDGVASDAPKGPPN